MQFESTLDITPNTSFAAAPATQSANAYLPESSPGIQVTKILLLLANRFDCEVVSAQLRECSTLEVVTATEQFSTGLERIKDLKPQIVVYDPRSHPHGMSLLKEMLLDERLENLVIFDDRVREGALIKAIQLPRTSYLTRQISAADLRRGLEAIGASSEQVYDAEIEARIVSSSKGKTLLQQDEGPALASLTQREFEVLEQVAGGWSVRECAARLNVAVSTIDNHKSKIMKKLDVRKASQLIHLAIHEGVV